MESTNGSDNSNGDGDNGQHEHQEQRSRSHSLTDSLYDGPLDHIIRNHPKLFVRPQYWTKRHASFLHVVCKEERSWSWSQHRQGAGQPGHEGATQHVDISNSDPQEPGEMQQPVSFSSETDTDVLRVPSFKCPSLPHPHLNSHISALRTKSSDGYSITRRISMDTLLVWKAPKPSNIWRTLLNPDHVGSPYIKARRHKSDRHINGTRGRLKVKSIPLSIRYGKRRISIALNSPTYKLAGKTPYAQRNAWRLIYVDCSQLEGRPLSKRQRRRQRMAARLGLDVEIGPTPESKEDERDGWPINKGYMAGLFIAMAQERQYEIEYKQEQQSQTSTADTQEASQEASQGPSPSGPELQPRYQILLTDNDEDSSCIHLYTAHVSDFLLEHFRTPSRLPDMASSEHEPHLVKIHHTNIPFAPYKSFRRRLRMTIMEYANGNADGFF
ncbi:hypothetical protein F4859DRAFT_253274 [Xylaria cf. heliscus]|nr:hypothetical protein F4859DRAFT_253274 [Xylaria cf. heliscus]